MTSTVYKIVPQELWQSAVENGRFDGASIDLADGFIHLSTESQARETARLHFAGQHGLLLVAINAAALGESLRFEASRGGDLFPHLYGPLALSAVLWQAPLPIGPDGLHQFPEFNP